MKHKEKIYKKTSIFSALVKMWINTFNYTGTSSRSEYWIPVLFQIIIAIISFGLLYISFRVDNFGDLEYLLKILSIILSVYLLVSMIPLISLTVRRLRDAGKSVWWILLVFAVGIGLIVLVVFCTASSIVAFNAALNETQIMYGPPPVEDIRYMK